MLAGRGALLRNRVQEQHKLDSEIETQENVTNNTRNNEVLGNESVVDTTPPSTVCTSSSPLENKDVEDEIIYHNLKHKKGFRLLYLKGSNIAIHILHDKWFNTSVLLCISWASLSVGLQTYDTLADSVMLDFMDTVVLLGFSIEAILKIQAEGLKPWLFFTGKEMRWNIFDFAIIIMSLPIWGTALGGSSIAILRMFRLLRIMKLVKRIPQLYMIIMGLVGGLKSIGYILLLLCLVFYLYAISGMYAWQNNDPFHFRNVPIAMITLFRISTLENWSNIMNMNYFGCDRFSGGYYSQDPQDAKSSLYCNTTALYGKSISELSESEIANQRYLNSGVATLYFITFVLVSAFVMLSLFIGAITMSMTQSMGQMKSAQAAADKKARAEKARLRAAETARRQRDRMERKKKELCEGQDIEQKQSRRKSIAETKEQRKMRAVLLQTWDDCDLTDLLNEQTWDTSSLAGRYQKLASLSSKIVENASFTHFVTGVIILAGIMVGLQSSPEIETAIGDILRAVDTAILVVFTTEVILKLVAEGLEPWQYFKTPWNTFDFIIVAGSFLKGNGGMLTMLRLLRLLRILKLVRAFPQLQVIVVALMKGIGSIGYIGLILLLCFYVFGILGNMLFAENDPFHFKYLHYAMISLFQCATMDGWSDVLYINYYGCDLYGYSNYKKLGYECVHNPRGIIAVIYFLAFIVLGAMVLITLFIGVVTTSMEEANHEMDEDKELLRRVRELRIRKNVEELVVNSYMQVFKMLDLDESGSVEEAELRAGLAAIGKYPSYEELKEMMDVVDSDGSGQIDLVEFVEFMIYVREKSVIARKKSMQTIPEANSFCENTGSYSESLPRDGHNIVANNLKSDSIDNEPNKPNIDTQEKSLDTSNSNSALIPHDAIGILAHGSSTTNDNKSASCTPSTTKYLVKSPSGMELEEINESLNSVHERHHSTSNDLLIRTSVIGNLKLPISTFRENSIQGIPVEPTLPSSLNVSPRGVLANDSIHRSGSSGKVVPSG